MLQLEFFPRTELNSLLDFQRLQAAGVPLSERKHLITHPRFFASPKSNDVIRRQHSDLVDKILGYRQKYVEEMLIAEAQEFDPDGRHDTWGPLLHRGIQTWIGLDLQTLQTPYSDCLRIFQLLKLRPYQHVVDLGAAYGRMGIVVGGHFIKNSFTGFEYVRSRVDEGNRVYAELGLSRCSLVQQDLFDSAFELPEADIYFIYDYGQVEHISRTLFQLKRISRRRPLKVVVRGKFTKQIIQDHYQWPSLKFEEKQEEFFSIYVPYYNG